MVAMDKWYYINKVSKLSDRYGDKLLEMMDLFKKDSLCHITYEEAKSFYENLNKK